MNSSRGHSCDQNIISKLVQKNSVSDFHNLMKQTQLIKKLNTFTSACGASLYFDVIK